MSQSIATDFIGIDIPGVTVHFYSSVTALRAGLVANPGEVREYFDRDGYRLTPRFDTEGRVTEMLRTTSQVPEDVLQARLDGVIANSRRRIEDILVTGVHAADRTSLDTAAAMLEKLADASFADRYRLLEQPPFADTGQPGIGRPGRHDRGAIHNCLAHARCW
ncbi:hypothetical protein [Actinoplanes sp. DH11]|uniref:hypothetical protein n=1 Tax=Actinoplanes sp. DH11 TaxID=2857011 RepID=UPI001E610C32|nr:hypothetical protein [Actinoplanes sp. DH11]